MKFTIVLQALLSVACGPLLLAGESDAVVKDHIGQLSNEVKTIMQGEQDPKAKVSELEKILDNDTTPVAERISSSTALGLLGNDDAIDALLQKIDLSVPTESGTKSVAVDALVLSGDKAVPALLQFIEKTEDKSKQARAVEAIVRIKGDKYQAFIDSLNGASPKVRDALLRFGISDEIKS